MLGWFDSAVIKRQGPQSVTRSICGGCIHDHLCTQNCGEFPCCEPCLYEEIFQGVASAWQDFAKNPIEQLDAERWLSEGNLLVSD